MSRRTPLAAARLQPTDAADPRTAAMRAGAAGPLGADRAGATSPPAWLALLLAIPPGYASPLYPAAGIALASVLVYGRRMLGGVALGAFAVNAVLIAARGGRTSRRAVAAAARSSPSPRRCRPALGARAGAPLRPPAADADRCRADVAALPRRLLRRRAASSRRALATLALRAAGVVPRRRARLHLGHLVARRPGRPADRRRRSS